ARRLLPHCAALPETPAPAAALAAAERACREALARLKAPWAQWADELQALCDDAVQRRLVDGRKLQARHYKPWFDALRDWCAQDDMRRPELSASARARLCPQGLAEAWKDGEPPAHPGLDALLTLFDE